MATGLILVAIQKDYFPGGAMELAGMDKAAENAALVLNQFRQKDWPIFHVQHISKNPGATFFLPDTKGVEINESVKPMQDETLILKNFPNSFRKTLLSAALNSEKINQLVICGAMSHMCIDATTRAAFDLEFTCAVIHDACASRDLEFNRKQVKAKDVHGAFMAALGSVYAQLVSCAYFKI